MNCFGKTFPKEPADRDRHSFIKVVDISHGSISCGRMSQCPSSNSLLEQNLKMPHFQQTRKDSIKQSMMTPKIYGNIRLHRSISPHYIKPATGNNVASFLKNEENLTFN